jgi:hypothetical protein
MSTLKGLVENLQKTRDNLHKAANFTDTRKWLAIRHIKKMYALFRKEENPLFLWTAYQAARKENLPLPEWVLNYLDDAANHLTSCDGKGDPWPIVRDAFKLFTWGQGTMFSRFRKYHLKYWSLNRVLTLKEERKEELPNICSLQGAAIIFCGI